MMIKAESYKIFSEIYCPILCQLHWSYFLAMDTGVFRHFMIVECGGVSLRQLILSMKLKFRPKNVERDIN